MYDFGDYGDYRASNMGSGKNGGDGLLALLLIIGLPLGFFIVYFIGCFLKASYN